MLYDCTGEEGLKGTVTKGGEYLKLKLFCTSCETNLCCFKQLHFCPSCKIQPLPEQLDARDSLLMGLKKSFCLLFKTLQFQLVHQSHSTPGEACCPDITPALQINRKMLQICSSSEIPKNLWLKGLSEGL